VSDANDMLGELLAEDQRLRCMANDFFTDINVIARDDGAPADAQAIALGFLTPTGEAGAQKLGACLLIEQPVLRDEKPGLQDGPMRIDGRALAVENRVLNIDTDNGGTGKRALSIARHYAKIMKGYFAGGLAQTFIIDRIGRTPASYYDEAADKETALVAWEILWHALEADFVSFAKVANPVISANPALTGSVPAQAGAVGAEVTITPPAGATAYYTIDLSYPTRPAVNAQAVEYTVPFTIDAACVLRVGCAQAGKIDSNVIAVKFT
jgi:hypothetical protein